MVPTGNQLDGRLDRIEGQLARIELAMEMLPRLGRVCEKMVMRLDEMMVSMSGLEESLGNRIDAVAAAIEERELEDSEDEKKDGEKEDGEKEDGEEEDGTVVGTGENMETD